MKQKVLFCLIALYLVSSFMVFAAENEDQLFVKSVPIVKIFSHELGYRILYYKVGLEMGAINLPYDWFNTSGGRARIYWGNRLSYPFFSVYWKDGVFDHIDLFVQENTSHVSWGVLNASRAEVQEDFNVTPETFEIEF